MNRRGWLVSVAHLLGSAACARAAAAIPHGAPRSSPGTPADAGGASSGDRVVRTEAEWRATLGSERFHVMREEGTEAPFTGAYWNEHRAGRYACAACGAPLFDSADKFESGTGWPSFTRATQGGRVEEHRDTSLGMVRTEVHCARCGGHLVHVFDDGPPPTGLRYCINSVSVAFSPR